MLPFVSWVGGKIKLYASSVSLLLLVRDDAAAIGHPRGVAACARRTHNSGDERGGERARGCPVRGWGVTTVCAAVN